MRFATEKEVLNFHGNDIACLDFQINKAFYCLIIVEVPELLVQGNS